MQPKSEVRLGFEKKQTVGSNEIGRKKIGDWSNLISLKEIFSKGLLCLLHSLESDRGFIVLINPLNRQYQIEAIHGFENQEVERLIGNKANTFLSKDLTLQAKAEQIGIPLKNSQAKSFVLIPIEKEKNLVGIIGVKVSPSKAQRNLNLLVFFKRVLASLIPFYQNVNSKNESGSEVLYDDGRVAFVIGESLAMKEVWSVVNKVAQSEMPVLICGEPGTGKKTVATLIHNLSPRKNQPLVKINCHSLPVGNLRKTIWGDSNTSGVLVAADKGSLLIEAIEALPIKLQAGLLSVLQDQRLYLPHQNRYVTLNIRILATTSANVPKLIKLGKFYPELYYWLNAFSINLLPLRQRREDIIPLAFYFLKVFSQKYHKPIQDFSTSALNLLTQHLWPGNVKELKICLEKAVLLAEGQRLEPRHFPDLHSETKAVIPLTDIIANIEKRLIIEALKECKGKRNKAAQRLGISSRMLSYKLHKYEIDPHRYT